jgi:hypothetical protein
MLSRILNYRIPAHDYEADQTYEDCYSNAVFSGCLTNDELNSLLGIPMPFTEQIEKAGKSLKAKKKELFIHREVPATRDKVSGEIEGLRNHINFISNERTKFFIYSAEYIGVLAKNSFLAEKYDQDIRDQLSEEEIRNIARSFEWSSLFNADFKPEIFNHDMINLINWTKTYNNIMQHPDKPDDYVIENDDLLDGWMMYISTKKEIQEPEGNEVFIIANNPQEIKEIQDRNSINTKVMLKHRAEKLKGGEIREQDLPEHKGLIKY